MAIIFTSNKPGQPTITIGGDDSSPFPSYSITRQENYSGDDTRLFTEYNITVNGVATVDGDPTIGGQLHAAVHAAAIDKLTINDIFPTLGFGVLKIAGYDGTYIQFEDARITSVQALPGQDSGGFRYQEYSISFSASLTEGDTVVPFVQQVEESWSLTENDNQFTCLGHNLIGEIYKTYTLTHTISATGKQNANGAVEAWRQAVLWIERRLVNEPNTEQIKAHINNSTDGPKFVPYWMNSQDELKTNLDPSWYSYNGRREVNNDIAAGSFSVTDTWLIAPLGVNATHTIETSFAGGQDEPNTITLNGTVTGLSTVPLGNSQHNRPQNFDAAEAAYLAVAAQFGGLAAFAYSKTNTAAYFPTNGALNPEPISKSVSQNRTEGTITWSATYNDAFKLGDPNLVAEENVSVEYKNEDNSERVIAIMPVIGREQGPVIQSFATDQIRSVAVTVSLTMTRSAKNEAMARTEANKIADKYKPNNGKLKQYSYDYTEDYGLITLTKEWLYK